MTPRLQALGEVAEYRAERDAVQPLDLPVDGSVSPLHAEVGERKRHDAHYHEGRDEKDDRDRGQDVDCRTAFQSVNGRSLRVLQVCFWSGGTEITCSWCRRHVNLLQSLLLDP